MPLMTERMVEALEIEGKTYEVHWYDDEGHGWERRENRRDAFERIAGVPQDARPGRAAEELAQAAPAVARLAGRASRARSRSRCPSRSARRRR